MIIDVNEPYYTRTPKIKIGLQIWEVGIKTVNVVI